MNLIVTRAAEIYSTAVERTLTAILSITHTRICKGMPLKCINPSFINRSGTSTLPIMNCREAKGVIVMTVIRYLDNIGLFWRKYYHLKDGIIVFMNKDRLSQKE